MDSLSPYSHTKQRNWWHWSSLMPNFLPSFLSPSHPHSGLAWCLTLLCFGFLAYHEGLKGRNRVYLYLTIIFPVPNTDTETWLVLNLFVGQRYFVDLQEPEAKYHLVGENKRCAPLGLDAAHMASMSTQNWHPRTLPGSPYFTDFVGSSWMASIMSL